ncbi:MAG: hypothetical protein U9R05_08750 [Chloroflexota bacterium]|nr:hypothetical protein [Chloroflexota bacterium]
MYAQPPEHRQRLSGNEIFFAVALPVLGMGLAIYYLTQSHTRLRGKRLLALAVIVALIWAVGMHFSFWSVFAEAPVDRAFFGVFTEAIESRYFFVVLAFAIIVPVVLIYRIGMVRQVASWRELAEETSLAFRRGSWLLPGKAQVTGSYRGRALKLYSYSPIIRDDPTRVTCLILQVNNVVHGTLRLERELIIRLIMGFLNPQQQYHSGDVAFNRAFLVESEPPEFATSLLGHPVLRQHLRRLRAGTTIELKGTYLSLKRVGSERDVVYLHFCLDVMSELADAIERTVSKTLERANLRPL